MPHRLILLISVLVSASPSCPILEGRSAAVRPLPTSTLSTVLHFYFAPHTVDSSSARVPFSIEDAPQPSRGFPRKGPL